MGVEPTLSAWKAEVLPLNYTRARINQAPMVSGNGNEPGEPASHDYNLVEGGGFEPPKAEPSDLQSDPFDRSGTPPNRAAYGRDKGWPCQPPNPCPKRNAAELTGQVSRAIRPGMH